MSASSGCCKSSYRQGELSCSTLGRCAVKCEAHVRNTKYEARNPKQIQISKLEFLKRDSSDSQIRVQRRQLRNTRKARRIKECVTGYRAESLHDRTVVLVIKSSALSCISCLSWFHRFQSEIHTQARKRAEEPNAV